MTEKPLRFERMSGLEEEQLGELECRVTELLEEPWDKEEGRPRELTLREALVVTCGYMRQNIIEDVWADIFDVDQSTISRYITFLTPFVEEATEEDRPSAEDAAAYNVRFRACYRQPARHGETGRIRCREDPEEGGRSVRRQGIHRD